MVQPGLWRAIVGKLLSERVLGTYFALWSLIEVIIIFLYFSLGTYWLICLKGSVEEVFIQVQRHSCLDSLLALQELLLLLSLCIIKAVNLIVSEEVIFVIHL